MRTIHLLVFLSRAVSLTGFVAIAMADPLTEIPVAPKKTPLPQPKKPEHRFRLNRDLEVSAITMNPINPVAGHSVNFTFYITNKGTVETPATETLVTFWDTQGGGDWGRFSVPTGNVPSLEPGQEYALKAGVTFITLGDSAAVAMKVDRFDKIEETDEDNNEKHYYFSVACKPEIAPYDYRKPKPGLSILHGLQNQELTYTLKVYNNGWCASEPGFVQVSCDEQQARYIDMPVVAGRRNIDLPILLTWANPGMKQCHLKLDYSNTNDESIENNNSSRFKVSIQPNAWPDP